MIKVVKHAQKQNYDMIWILTTPYTDRGNCGGKKCWSLILMTDSFFSVFKNDYMFSF